MSFNDTYPVGVEAEMDVALAFLRKGWWASRRNAFERRDLAVMAPCGAEIIEVKNEIEYADSGNICIEMLQGEVPRPSGISTSQSTICIHWFSDICDSVIFRTQPMRLYLKERGLKPKQFAGADNFNKGVLLSITDLINLHWADHRPVVDLPDSYLFKD